MILIFWLATPSLAAVTLAAPPHTALRTAVPLVAAIVITRLLVVLHDTGRSVSATPVELVGVALKVTVWPSVRFKVTPSAAPDIAMLETGGRITGPPPPGVYCMTPPSKVCRWSPPERTISCVVGRPRL